jgi:hypothetical protein
MVGAAYNSTTYPVRRTFKSGFVDHLVDENETNDNMISLAKT